MPDGELTRRRLLQAGLAVPPFLLLGCGDDEGADAGAKATPSCGDRTEAQTEGPFWTPDSPRRRSLLEDGLKGTNLILTGLVMNTNCEPISRATLDFWQANKSGGYDNEGFTLRGHQRTGSKGRYRLETILPGLYGGRTRHIHVKAQKPGGNVLTTQLYFPGVERNESDSIFDEDLLAKRWRKKDGRRYARFDFVLA